MTGSTFDNLFVFVFDIAMAMKAIDNRHPQASNPLGRIDENLTIVYRTRFFGHTFALRRLA